MGAKCCYCGGGDRPLHRYGVGCAGKPIYACDHCDPLVNAPDFTASAEDGWFVLKANNPSAATHATRFIGGFHRDKGLRTKRGPEDVAEILNGLARRGFTVDTEAVQ